MPQGAGCPNCGKQHRTLTLEQCQDRSMSESKLQSRVVYRAKKHGWTAIHAGKGQVGPSGFFVTPMAPGWPDLTCLKAGNRALFIELKRETGVLEPEQLAMLQLLNRCGVRAIVVRPSDLREGRVEAIFRDGDPLGADTSGAS